MQLNNNEKWQYLNTARDCLSDELMGLYFFLFSHYNEEKGYAYPSHKVMVDQLLISHSKLKQNLALLEYFGFIERLTGCKGKNTKYIFPHYTTFKKLTRTDIRDFKSQYGDRSKTMEIKPVQSKTINKEEKVNETITINSKTEIKETIKKLFEFINIKPTKELVDKVCKQLFTNNVQHQQLVIDEIKNNLIRYDWINNPKYSLNEMTRLEKIIFKINEEVGNVIQSKADQQQEEEDNEKIKWIIKHNDKDYSFTYNDIIDFNYPENQDCEEFYIWSRYNNNHHLYDETIKNGITIVTLKAI